MKRRQQLALQRYWRVWTFAATARSGERKGGICSFGVRPLVQPAPSLRFVLRLSKNVAQQACPLSLLRAHVSYLGLSQFHACLSMHLFPSSPRFLGKHSPSLDTGLFLTEERPLAFFALLQSPHSKMPGEVGSSTSSGGVAAEDDAVKMNHWERFWNAQVLQRIKSGEKWADFKVQRARARTHPHAQTHSVSTAPWCLL